MFNNIPEQWKKVLFVLLPSSIVVIVSTAAHKEIPLNTFAYGWYALLQVIFCVRMIMYIHKNYGKVNKENEN